MFIFLHHVQAISIAMLNTITTRILFIFKQL